MTLTSIQTTTCLQWCCVRVLMDATSHLFLLFLSAREVVETALALTPSAQSPPPSAPAKDALNLQDLLIPSALGLVEPRRVAISPKNPRRMQVLLLSIPLLLLIQLNHLPSSLVSCLQQPLISGWDRPSSDQEEAMQDQESSSHLPTSVSALVATILQDLLILSAPRLVEQEPVDIRSLHSQYPLHQDNMWQDQQHLLEDLLRSQSSVRVMVAPKTPTLLTLSALDPAETKPATTTLLR